MLTDLPSVIVKKRHVEDLMAYVMDQKITIRLVPKSGAEECEVTFELEDVVKAVALGMFLRELKLELSGFHMPSLPSKTKTRKASGKQALADGEEEATDKPLEDNAPNPQKPVALKNSSPGLFPSQATDAEEPDSENMF